MIKRVVEKERDIVHEDFRAIRTEPLNYAKESTE